MHICVVVFQFPVRSETFVSEHVAGLRARGHRVTVLTKGRGKDISENESATLELSGLEIINYPEFGGNCFLTFLRMLFWVARNPRNAKWMKLRPPWSRAEMFQSTAIVQRLRLLKADIVHVHFGTLVAPIQLVLAEDFPADKLKIVVTWHGYDANQETKSRGENIYHQLFAAEHWHTVGSSFMHARLLRLGANSATVSVIPMGVDIERFTYSPRKLNDGETLRIISVGRLDEMKGHAHLIAAVARLIQQGEKVHLQIIGDGCLREVLETQITKTGLASSAIELVGAKTSAEVKMALQRAHLFALTGITARSGRVETQGVVFAEAQASGLPVIASAVGGVSESILDWQSGILCPPGNELAIADAILHFLRHPEDIIQFGHCGRLFVEHRFSRNRMLDSFENLYSEIQTENL
jgi:colanic acid/amylovoran biosynthesis glycosyltransferase